MSISYGPTALATPANGITIGRVLLTPVLISLVLGTGHSWEAFALWTALATTDGLDGYLARRHGVTRSGAFLDPLADKFLVLGAMFTLVVKHEFWLLPVSVIAGRELVISLYRSYVGRRGVSVPARPWAKVKTFVQSLAVGFALMPPVAPHRWFANLLLWISVILTVVTGAQYLLDGQEAAGRSDLAL